MTPKQLNTFALMAEVMHIHAITGSDEPTALVSGFGAGLKQGLARNVDYFSAHQLAGGERERHRGGGRGAHQDHDATAAAAHKAVQTRMKNQIARGEEPTHAQCGLEDYLRNKTLVQNVIREAKQVATKAAQGLS